MPTVAGISLILAGWVSLSIGVARVVGPAMRIADERRERPAGR